MNTTGMSQPERTLRRYLLNWALGVLVAVWLALIALAWTTAFREARQFSDGQMTAVAKLWLTAMPYRLELQTAAEAPDLQHEYLQDVAVVAWDDGRLVAEFANQHRVYVPSEELPDQLVHAFISAEDKSFFEHAGIDYWGMFRGTVLNALQDNYFYSVALIGQDDSRAEGQ